MAILYLPSVFECSLQVLVTVLFVCVGVRIGLYKSMEAVSIKQLDHYRTVETFCLSDSHSDPHSLNSRKRYWENIVLNIIYVGGK